LSAIEIGCLFESTIINSKVFSKAKCFKKDKFIPGAKYATKLFSSSLYNTKAKTQSSELA